MALNINAGAGAVLARTARTTGSVNCGGAAVAVGDGVAGAAVFGHGYVLAVDVQVCGGAAISIGAAREVGIGAGPRRAVDLGLVLGATVRRALRFKVLLPTFVARSLVAGKHGCGR